ncbi:uncharacterized protein METZ01_LOCUS416628, partial [marine metagenome]
MQIHVQRGEDELGTFTLEELEQSLTEGRLKESDLGWHEGMKTWIPLSQLCEQLETKPESKSPAKENSDEKSLPALGQGRYQRKKFLGEGAVGQVWLAYDTQLERSVALKLLHQDNTDQVAGLKGLKDEVQKSLELTHPNIIRAYDLVEPPQEAAFITMEFVEGEVLSDKLKQQPEGRFEWPDLEPYILNLCDAL